MSCTYEVGPYAVEPNEVGPNTGHQPSSVSLLTVTQYSRRECLANLSMLIHRQIYKNIIEWVIVEGSPVEADAQKNAEILKKMKQNNIPITYVPFRPAQSLSDLRNAGNAVCKGDIIICMDDDDYYPPTRVSHAVYRLQESAALIAGCSQAYIYFYNTGQFFQFKRIFGKGHSTNNCLAYKRAYLETHQHLPGLSKGEEASFTNDWTEPMEQLDPTKTIVISGHGSNTVDKSRLSPEIMLEMRAGTITDYIPLPLLLKMEKILYV
jgi:glycosyltransferase involved in cell wall biosynthesis